MKKRDKIMLSIIATVFICTGVMMVFILKDKFPAGENPKVTEVETSEVEEMAETLLAQASEALDEGQLELAKQTYEQLMKEFGGVKTFNDLDEPTTYADLAKQGMDLVNCFIDTEGPSSNPERTVVDTLNQLVTAINQRQTEQVRVLLSCAIVEGKPDSEWDPTTPDAVAKRMTGKIEGEGYVDLGDATFRPAGLSVQHHLITNGKVTLGLAIEPAPHAPNTNRVTHVLWGAPGDF